MTSPGPARLARLFEISRRTGGPIHLEVAGPVAGLSPRTLRRYVRDQGWWRPFPAVVAPPGTPVTPWTWARAAAVHAGAVRDPELVAYLETLGHSPRLAAITGWSAAHLLGVCRSAPSRVHLVLPSARGLRSRPHLDPRGSQTLTAAQVTWVRHVPVATPSRVVHDLAARCRHERLRAVVIDLLQARLLTLDELECHLNEHRFPGRDQLRRVMTELRAAGRTDSPFELRVRWGLSEEGVPLDRGQVEVPTPAGPIHLDLGLQAIRFGIDTEGFGWHSKRAQLSADARRSNALARAEDDWRVVRVTWDDMSDRWAEVLTEVREVVAAQSRRHLGLPWPRPSDVRS